MLRSTAEAWTDNWEPGGEAWMQRRVDWQAQEEQDEEESENNTMLEN